MPPAGYNTHGHAPCQSPTPDDPLCKNHKHPRMAQTVPSQQARLLHDLPDLTYLPALTYITSHCGITPKVR